MQPSAVAAVGLRLCALARGVNLGVGHSCLFRRLAHAAEGPARAGDLVALAMRAQRAVAVRAREPAARLCILSLLCLSFEFYLASTRGGPTERYPS